MHRTGTSHGHRIARASMSWKQRREKDLAKAANGPSMTDGPVNLQFVVSSDGSEPWGIGFARSLVNSKTKAAVAKLRSPSDGFTWIFNWYKDLKIWASFKIPGDKGFCTLAELLESEDTLNLWNNKALVASWTFVKDKVDGEQISEEMAIEMADLFPSEPSSEPVTPKSSGKRRLFEASPAGSSSLGNATKGPRGRRCAVLAEIPANPARAPSRQERDELTCFAFVCNAAEYKVVPKLGGRRYRGWYVRYRVPYRHHVNVLQLLCQIDTEFCDNPDSKGKAES